AEVDNVPESPTVESFQLDESIESSNKQLFDTPEHPTPTVLRWFSRSHVPNRRCMDYMLLTEGGEAKYYAEC
ncbi:hypothetical protein A2U01_0090042, partial [Trifolium medium]|nr:hypothetical protein [Trifolium medium]